MPLFSLIQCSEALGVDLKTLRVWRRLAQLPLVPHPLDARIKCLSSEQVAQLAMLHGRPLTAPMASSAPASTISLPTTSSPLPQETDMWKQLSSLEKRVATLSEQVAQLALLLLQERDHTLESRLTQLETAIQVLLENTRSSSPPSGHAVSKKGRAQKPKPAQSRQPKEQRARARMPPVIEYRAPGTYVIVSSQDGEVQVEPDSPAWFAWLTTLSSFRFVGPRGHLTAYHGNSHGRPSRSWVAYRREHQRSFRLWLGVSERFTIAYLEQTAARLQEQIDAFS